METLLSIFRNVLVIGIWFYVGFQILPAARSTGRNGFLWYLAGLFSFYIPFIVIGFAPQVIMLLALTKGAEIPPIVVDYLGVTFFGLGIVAAFTCLYRVKRAVAKQP